MKTTQKLEDIIKRTSYRYVNDNLTTKNFSIPDTIQTKNWKLIKMDKSFSSQEALDRIKAEGCRPANAYELALWFENHGEEIPKRYWCLAFGQLWQDPDGDRRVPYVYVDSVGDFDFYLDDFGDDWGSGYVLLCFCDEESLDTKILEKSSDSLSLESRLQNVEKFLQDNFNHFHV